MERPPPAPPSRTRCYDAAPGSAHFAPLRDLAGTARTLAEPTFLGPKEINIAFNDEPRFISTKENFSGHIELPPRCGGNFKI